ncbi:Phosphatidylinositol 3,4,5-trisphosphate 3-phosphatase ptn1-like protein [Elsinoe fawcettii]|nr:Phosphatidylinositol 3,4,5-trisphosphate 3-phosphatase ptn1-like protein [Elsinoe fawcettii]
MASLLRQIVSGPRARHPEAGLDLCYVTDNIIATSGPSGTYPQLAYRTPLKQLVKFLDEKHEDQWAIWEFRAEGTGYPDSEVYDRIYHYPWPDHHPPPFALIPLIMGSMRNWLKGEDGKGGKTSNSNGHIEAGDRDEAAQQDGPDKRKSRELVKKLEAIKVEQDDRPLTGEHKASAGSEGELFVDAPSSLPPTPSFPPDPHMLTLPPGADGTNSSTPSASGTSTPNSTRRKKEVRWRESTLLPPKEIRAPSPSSPDPEKSKQSSSSRDNKNKKPKSDKQSVTDKDSETVSRKSRNPLSRKRSDLRSSMDGKMIKSSKPSASDSNGDGFRSRPGEASSEKKERVVVVHCKAGKGRSGTVSCSYLISQEGWSAADALARFTERRMRPGFGAGVSIPSQLRWVSYVDRWTKGRKIYVERSVEILEVHVWGLRDRVKVSVEGYVEEGKKIEVVHSFTKEERSVVREEKKGQGVLASVGEVVGQEREKRRARGKTAAANGDEKDRTPTNGMTTGESVARVEEEGKLRKAKTTYEDLQDEEGGGDIVFKPKNRVITATGDVNIDFERRNKGVSNLTMITSVAHVWFNAFFEGDGPERDGHPLESGVFEQEWDKMDGIKGSSRKGTRAFDRLAVVWKAVGDAERNGTVITMPEEGEGIRDTKPADWRGGVDKDATRDLGEEAESLTSGMTSQTSLTQNHETESIRKGQEESGRSSDDSGREKKVGFP